MFIKAHDNEFIKALDNVFIKDLDNVPGLTEEQGQVPIENVYTYLLRYNLNSYFIKTKLC